MLRPKEKPKDWEEATENGSTPLKDSVVVAKNEANSAERENAAPAETAKERQGIKTLVVVKQQQKSKKESTIANEKAHEVDMASKGGNTTIKNEEHNSNSKIQHESKSARPEKNSNTKMKVSMRKRKQIHWQTVRKMAMYPV